MADVGSLTVNLIAQTASFNANISKAAANLNSSAARMNRSVAGVQDQFQKLRRGAEILAGALALREIGRAVKTSLDFAGSLGETAQQVGVTAQQLQVYRYIGGQVGVTQEEMDKGLAKLTVSLGKGALGARAQADAFTALGISLRDANGHVKTAGDVLPEIANRLGKISDPAQRAAAEVALFGKAGQKLDTILSGGQGNIDEYAKRAKELGLVLDDDLINQADEAADRMEELSTQMKVNFAGVVAQNATSILALASAVGTLTGQVIGFISQYPRFSGALAGVIAGSRFGLPGAIAGGGAGFVGGAILGKQAEDQNMDLKFRAKKLAEARADFDRIRANKTGGPLFAFRKQSGDTGGTLQGATQELNRQAALTMQAVAASKKPPVAPVADLPDFLAPSGGGGGKRGPTGPSAEQLAEQAARRERDFQDKLASLNGDLLNAKQDNLTNASDIATNARQQLMAERAGLIIDTEAKVKAGDLTRVQADLIEQKAAQVAAQKLLTINTEEAARKADDAFTLQVAANDNQRDILQAQDALATTASERRKTAMALLDLDKQEEKLRLQHIIDLAKIGQATAAEAKAAQDRLSKLDAIYGARAESVNRQTEGPMAAYLRGIPKGADEIGERVEQLEVAELESVRQGLDNAISKVLGTKDPLIIGLIDLFIQENLLKPIAAALQKANASGGGGGSGFLGKLLGIGASLFGGSVSAGAVARLTPGVGAVMDANPGLFANGTTGAPGGWSLVGEDGPELLNLPTGARVIPNHRLPQMASHRFSQPANDTGDVHIHINGKMSEREARVTGRQAASAFQREMANSRRMGIAG